MVRSWMVLWISCAVPWTVFAQCGIGTQFTQYGITASAIDQKGLGGLRLTMRAACPNEPDAHIKFKLDTTSRDSAGNSILIVSPSSGTTPLEIEVGVNPNAAANSA